MTMLHTLDVRVGEALVCDGLIETFRSNVSEGPMSTLRQIVAVLPRRALHHTECDHGGNS